MSIAQMKDLPEPPDFPGALRDALEAHPACRVGLPSRRPVLGRRQLLLAMCESSNMGSVARLPGSGGNDVVTLEVLEGGGFLAFQHHHHPLTNHLHRVGLDDTFEVSVPAVPTSKEHLVELREAFRAWLDSGADFRWSEQTEAGVSFELRISRKAEEVIVGPGKAAFTYSISNGGTFHATRSFVIDPSCVRLLLYDFQIG